MDVGALLDEIRKDEEAGQKGTLELCLRQGKRAVQVRKALGNEWRNALMDATGLKKSTWYDRLSINLEFGPLIWDGEAVDPAYQTITPTALKLLLKIAKGCADNVKEQWLCEAAALSYSDLKARIDEITGKEKHECGPFEETKAWKCLACGKIHKTQTDTDA